MEALSMTTGDLLSAINCYSWVDGFRNPVKVRREGANRHAGREIDHLVIDLHLGGSPRVVPALPQRHRMLLRPTA